MESFSRGSWGSGAHFDGPHAEAFKRIEPKGSAELAESHLTGSLFRQILGRIERLA
jgi:hypothetical protein